MRTIDKLLAPHLKLAPVLVKRAPTLDAAFDDTPQEPARGDAR